MTGSHLAQDDETNPPLRPNLPEYTVSEISQAVKRTLEGDFGHVRVRGEISGCKRHTSGHCYLTLKDADSAIDGVIWRGTVARLGLRPEDGMDVICTGRITTYPSRSKYQLVIESVELAGAGALLKLLEDRKKKLAAEGLFDAERKRPLPFLPEVIGVVTSPTGAVIRDILHRLADRFPRRVVVWPVLVQGEGAAEQVARAIAGFNALTSDGPIPRPDLLIVARGGGSLEDLMAFNEEIVVRAAAASKIPLISAVGHETDTTLIDFASDRRAPTPTAAAEIAVPVRRELAADLRSHVQRLAQAATRFLDEKKLRIEGLARGLPDLQGLIDDRMQRLDEDGERLRNGLRIVVSGASERLSHLPDRLSGALRTVVASSSDRLAHLPDRLRHGFARLIQRDELRLDALAKRLEGQRLAHDNVLKRGYALVRDAAGAVVTSAAGVLPGADLALEFHDGKLAARATGSPAKPKEKPPKAGGQGSLL